MLWTTTDCSLLPLIGLNASVYAIYSSGDTLLRVNRHVNNCTCWVGPEKSRLIGYTRIYAADIVPAQEHNKYQYLIWVKLIFRHRMIVSFFLTFPCLECIWIHLKPLTFTGLQIPSSKTGLFCVIKLDIGFSTSDFCFLGEFYLVTLWCFEIITNKSGAACTCSGSVFEKVITTTNNSEIPRQYEIQQ